MEEINDLEKDTVKVVHKGECKNAFVVKGKDGIYGDVVRKGYTLVVLRDGMKTPLEEVDHDHDGEITITQKTIDEIYKEIDKHDEEIKTLQKEVGKNRKDILTNTDEIRKNRESIMDLESHLKKRSAETRIPSALLVGDIGLASLDEGDQDLLDYTQFRLRGWGEIKRNHFYGKLASDITLRDGRFADPTQFLQFAGDLMLSGGLDVHKYDTHLHLGAAAYAGVTQTDQSLDTSDDHSSHRFGIGIEGGVRSPHLLLDASALFGGMYRSPHSSFTRYSLDLEANVTDWLIVGIDAMQMRLGHGFGFAHKDAIHTTIGPFAAVRLPGSDVFLGAGLERIWIENRARKSKGLTGTVRLESRFY